MNVLQVDNTSVLISNFPVELFSQGPLQQDPPGLPGDPQVRPQDHHRPGLHVVQLALPLRDREQREEVLLQMNEE